MTAIHTRTKVGPDGNVIVPVGIADAGREVDVMVAPAPLRSPVTALSKDEWARFVRESAGAWEGDLPEPSDPPPADRDTF